MTTPPTTTDTPGGGEMDLYRYDRFDVARIRQADMLADADAAARARRVVAARRWARRAERASRRAARASAAVR